MKFMLVEWNEKDRKWETVHYSHDWLDLDRQWKLHPNAKLMLAWDQIDEVAKQYRAKEILRNLGVKV